MRTSPEEAVEKLDSSSAFESDPYTRSRSLTPRPPLRNEVVSLFYLGKIGETEPKALVLKLRYLARAGSVSDGFPRFREDESGRVGSSLTLPALVFTGNRNSAISKGASRSLASQIG